MSDKELLVWIERESRDFSKEAFAAAAAPAASAAFKWGPELAKAEPGLLKLVKYLIAGGVGYAGARSLGQVAEAMTPEDTIRLRYGVPTRDVVEARREDARAQRAATAAPAEKARPLQEDVLGPALLAAVPLGLLGYYLGRKKKKRPPDEDLEVSAADIAEGLKFAERAHLMALSEIAKLAASKKKKKGRRHAGCNR